MPIRRDVVLGLLLTAITIAVYAQVHAFDFVNWDDPTYVTANAHVSGGLTWSAVSWALTTGGPPYWQPVTWLSHAMDVQLFGLDAGMHHLTSLFVHVCTSLLIFVLFRAMTGRSVPSAIVAAVFAVHPLHVESVAWIAERKDVLSAAFWFLAIWAYVRFRRRRSAARYGVLLLLFGLGLMAKPMVVTLPVILLLCDLWPLGVLKPGPGQLTAWKTAIVEKVPLVLMSVGATIATAILQKRAGALATLDAIPIGLRLSHAVVGCVEYLGKIFWPVNLSAFYPTHAYTAIQVGAAVLCLVVVSVACLLVRRRHPYLLVGWLWFLVSIAPVTGLVQAGEQRIADRFTYIPMVGIALAVAFAGDDIARHWPTRAVARGLTLAGLGMIVALAIAAHRQAGYWANSVTLWTHATEVTPDSYIAFEDLGQALRQAGRLDEARRAYDQALPLSPSPQYEAVLENSIGILSTLQGRGPDASAHFLSAVRLDPGFGQAHLNLGNALAAEGSFDAAIREYRLATQLEPGFIEAWVGLGSALLSRHDAAGGAEAFTRATQLDTASPQAHNGLGVAFALLGNQERALAEYQRALELDPALPTAHFNLAVLLIKQGHIQEARGHLVAALNARPGYREAADLLARLPER